MIIAYPLVLNRYTYMYFLLLHWKLYLYFVLFLVFFLLRDEKRKGKKKEENKNKKILNERSLFTMRRTIHKILQLFTEPTTFTCTLYNPLPAHIEQQWQCFLFSIHASHRWKSAYKIWSKLMPHTPLDYTEKFSLYFFFFCSSTWHNSATLHLYINFCVLFTHLLLLIHMVILYEYSTYNISFFLPLFHYSEMDNTYAHKMWVGWMDERQGKIRRIGGVVGWGRWKK